MPAQSMRPTSQRGQPITSTSRQYSTKPDTRKVKPNKAVEKPTEFQTTLTTTSSKSCKILPYYYGPDIHADSLIAATANSRATDERNVDSNPSMSSSFQ